VPQWVFLYAALLAHSNSTCNVFVYYVENENFRLALKSLVKRVRGVFIGNMTESMAKSTTKSTIDTKSKVDTDYSQVPDLLLVPLIANYRRDSAGKSTAESLISEIQLSLCSHVENKDENQDYML